MIQNKAPGKDVSAEDMIEKFPTARTFPQIMIDGKSIGGYTEFERFISAI